jgi:hypothetical protein
MTKKSSSKKSVSTGLRSKILASKPSAKPKSWFEKLRASDPQKADEVKNIVDEWADSSSEVAEAYPTRHQLFCAIAKEFGVSPQSVKSVFGETVKCR